MNDRWRREDGSRWNDSERIRVARRFRHHVRTRTNPRGRIIRRSCAFADHPCHRDECLAPDSPAEFCHVDYSRPFFGTWGCIIAHRRLEHGSLKLTAKRTYDYSALVAPLLKPGLTVAARRGRLARTGTDDVPF